jgi:urease beta subunit
MIPGEYIIDGPDLELNPGLAAVTLKVVNTGDRPVQIGADFHFFETNRALVFDRVKAYGMHLDLPSGTSVRFEPGDVKEVRVIPYGGHREIYGFNGLVMGRLDDPYTRTRSLKRCLDEGYGHRPSEEDAPSEPKAPRSPSSPKRSK